MHRNVRTLMYIAFAVVFFVFGSHRAQAQCSNGNINSAYQMALHRAPRGAGMSGECNPAYYGGGAWSSQADLVRRVGAASYCSNNPWIGQIYLNDFNRYPNWSECTANYNYNGSMSYMQLDSQIRAFVARGERPAATTSAMMRPPAGEYMVASNGALIDSNGNTVLAPNSYLLNAASVINAGGANVINAGGANVINAGGANVIQPQAGWIIAANIGYSTMSVGGKRVISVTRFAK